MASFTVPCPKASTLAGFGSTAQKNWNHGHIKQTLSLNRRGFGGSSLVESPFSGIEGLNKKKSSGLIVCALNEVSRWLLETLQIQHCACFSTENAPSGGKVDSAIAVSNQSSLPDESSISTFMSQVSDLIKDIMELQLKQQDCEIVSEKKSSTDHCRHCSLNTWHCHHLKHHSTFAPPADTVARPPSCALKPALRPQARPAAKPGSSHPPMKSPMAGTFYRCLGLANRHSSRWEIKCRKGQVICIIEAMKLMNEIEADQSGTVTEILAEDGKPVSRDAPLLVIVP